MRLYVHFCKKPDRQHSFSQHLTKVLRFCRKTGVKSVYLWLMIF